MNKRCSKCNKQYTELENYCSKCDIELAKEVNKCSENMNNVVNVTVNIENIDIYTKKLKEYVELLTKAKSLAEEIALVNFEVNVI